MSALIDLITAWEQYSQQKQAASVREFCEQFLAKTDAAEPDQAFQTVPSVEQMGGLLRTLGRITSAYAFYHRAAMSQTALPSPDGFYYLNGLATLGEVRKTELINYLFAEYTTGMEAINRLLAEQLMSERLDPTDKRARLICLTDRGKEVLVSCYALSAKVSQLVFGDLSAANIAQCQHLLQPIEQRHSQLIGTLKGKDFGTMYAEITGENGPLP